MSENHDFEKAHLCEIMTVCLNKFVTSCHEIEIEEMSSILLDHILKLSGGKYGYIACSHTIDQDQMKYVATREMETYNIKLHDTVMYNPQRTFFTPSHLRAKWLLIPLHFKNQLCGVVGIENATPKSHSEFQEFIKIFCPTMVSNIIGCYLTFQTVSDNNDHFLSMISHELRSPLNSIVGMSRILKESSPLTEDQKTYIHVIVECTYQLLELINDILDFSKMGCDQLKLDSEPFDLHSCVEEVYDLVYLKVQEKKLNFQSQVEPRIPLFMGDKKRIRQILLNLVHNAIKFTDQGNITVKIYKEKKENDKYCVHFEVEDTGMGIPQTHLDTVFKSFQQVKTQKPNVEGVGLGLAICKKLCQMMGGDIHIKSTTLGRGTCMHFFLLLNLAPEYFQRSKEKESMMNTLKDKNVLLIDSQTPRRIKLLGDLVKMNMKPYACSTTIEGLSYLSHMTFDFVLLEENKLENESIVKEIMNFYLPLIYLQDKKNLEPKLHEITKDLTVGVYLSDDEIFSDQCDHKIATTFISLIKEKKETKVSPIPLDILVVEDNCYNLFVIMEMLKKLNYDEKMIDKAVNGSEAVLKGVSKVYDVILMDLLLPSIDGISACTQILNYHKSRVPKHLKASLEKYESLLPTVLALTALVTSSTKEKCKNAGMKGFLSKPIDKDELETMLSIVAKKRQNSKIALKALG